MCVALYISTLVRVVAVSENTAILAMHLSIASPIPRLGLMWLGMGFCQVACSMHVLFPICGASPLKPIPIQSPTSPIHDPGTGAGDLNTFKYE